MTRRPPPPTSSDFTRCSAGDLVALVARGDVSSLEVVEAHIARIEAVNPTINAVVVKRFDAARRDARAADEKRASGAPIGRLHGVSVTVKECFNLTGTPSTFGTPSRRRNPAQADDPLVRRLVEAGAIIIGKTNVPQALIYNESDNAVYGRTRNPWNLGRTPGGSSGGEAAIIAAGGSPLGLANDVAGSLRLPATFCGISSLKPTAPRMLDESYSQFLPTPHYPIVSVAGPMARDVDDLALVMRILGDIPNRLLAQPVPVPDPAEMDVSRLRVAYFIDDGLFPPTAAVKRAVLDAVAMLKAHGATCTAWTPPDIARADDIFVRLIALDGGSLVRKIIGRDRPQPQIAPLLFLAGRSRATLARCRRFLGTLGQGRFAAHLSDLGFSLSDLPQLIEMRNDYLRCFGDALNAADGGPFDAIVCPVTSLPAWTHGSSGTLSSGGAYCALWNLLGYPAGVVPVTRVRGDEAEPRASSRDLIERAARAVETGSAGLPVGVQVVARPWHEHVALAAMKVIQDEARTHEGYPATPVEPPLLLSNSRRVGKAKRPCASQDEGSPLKSMGWTSKTSE